MCVHFTDVCSTIHPMWCVQRWKNTFWANSGFVAGADYIQCHTYNDTPCQVAERYWIMTVPTFASFSNIYAVLIDGCPPPVYPTPKGQIWSDCQMVAITDCTLMAGLPHFSDLIEFESKPSCFADSPSILVTFWFQIRPTFSHHLFDDTRFLFAFEVWF